jgi:hypothetical protein
MIMGIDVQYQYQSCKIMKMALPRRPAEAARSANRYNQDNWAHEVPGRP